MPSTNPVIPADCVLPSDSVLPPERSSPVAVPRPFLPRAAGRLALILAATLVLAHPAAAWAASSEPSSAPGPLSLEQAIALALRSHPDLISAQDAARKALLNLQDARAGAFQLNASLGAGEVDAQQNVLGPGGSQPTTTTPSANGTLTLSVPLFDGWKTPAAIAAAKGQLDAADADRETARQSLELSVIEKFWNLRKAELLEASQLTLRDQAQRTLDQTRAALTIGSKTQDDVDQAQIGVLSAQSDLLTAEGNTLQARAQLAQVLGVRSDGLSIVGDPEPAPSGDLDAMGTLAAALDRRPDALAARSREAAAQAAYDAAKGDRWPQVTFSTSYQEGNLAANPVTGVRQQGAFAGTWQAGIGLQYNLFDMGKVNRAIERARLDRQIAEASYDKVVRQVQADLEQALAAAHSAEARVELGTQEVELARTHLSVVQQRYRDGLALAIEVDDARSKYRTAVDQRVQALIDDEIATAQLRRAAGML